MGYAGICAPNVQSNSDDYFHINSIILMSNFITGSGNCSANTITGNNAPVADAGSNFTIPKSTPFILEGAATDADSDPITYCWEQYDKQIATMPPSASSTSRVKRTPSNGIKIGLGGLDFGFGGFMHEMSLDAPAEYPDLKTNFGKSIHATIHTVRLSVPLGNPHISLNTSLAFGFRNYAFSTNNTLEANTSVLTFLPATTNYDVNCLRTTHIEIPLMLAFSSKPNQKNKSIKNNINQ